MIKVGKIRVDTNDSEVARRVLVSYTGRSRYKQKARGWVNIDGAAIKFERIK